MDPPDARAAVARRAPGPRRTTSSRRSPTSPSSPRARWTSSRSSTSSTAASCNVILPDRRGAHRRRRALDRPEELRGVLPDDGRASSGESENFDGNGSYTRLQSAGGGYTVQTAADRAFTERPARLGAAAPAARHAAGARRRSRPTTRAPCYKQPPPDLNARQDRGGPVKRQIKKQLPVFVAILFLLVASLGIAGYILSNQRFYLPAWVPAVGTDFYEVKAEMPTAPGRGAGPGADREHRRREGRRGGLREPRGRHRRRRHEDPGEVRADLPRRHGPAAPEDRPEGHVSSPSIRARAAPATLPEGGSVRWRTRCRT